VQEILYQIDISTLHRLQDHHQIEMNGIGRIKIKTSEPLFYDSYRRNRNTGSVVLINPNTFETVAAGMIL
jgi:sulfate adenylyltransferase subunit 1